MAATYEKLVDQFRRDMDAIPDKEYLRKITRATGARRLASDNDITRTFSPNVATTIFQLLDTINNLYDSLIDLLSQINRSEENSQPELNSALKEQIEVARKVKTLYDTLIILIDKNTPQVV